ncbi:hypothetical protein [Streptomyces sp. AS02]|uniref:hypothetical protein n=1 Tax=Streptomyces sp. AS02 TaxID=2938946 RepID=UPI00201FC1D2|nr:hypothetical protein [Streptomyces sp. AS02]MCL8011388.1 hypothetical protein [Streptomyces sp. AS02]
MTIDDQRLLALLRNLDDPEHWEFPRDYDHVATRARFDQLAAHLDQAFDCACSVDRGVQDASFHGDIVIPAAVTKSRDFIVVRFSNFGSLITATAGGVAADTAEPADGLHDEDRSRITAVSAALDRQCRSEGHVFDGGAQGWTRRSRYLSAPPMAAVPRRERRTALGLPVPDGATELRPRPP